VFKINNTRDKGHPAFIELQDHEGESYAKLNLNNGGSLQELSLQKKIIIKDLSPLPYSDTFASSILFPFASRIKNGEYTFLDKTYRLPINEIEKQNALHGLVFDKTFEVIAQSSTEHSAEVTLEFRQPNQIEGFPFEFSLQLIYVLTRNNITLEIKVLNLSNAPFPFSLGWHPYFYSSNLYSSTLSVNSSRKITFDDNLIAVNEETYEGPEEIDIKDERFDDCFVLNDNKVGFKTCDYELNLHTSSVDNYLQVYTINEANVIAIEPLTAAPNSFNNNQGLQILEPNKAYSVSWHVNLISKNVANNVLSNPLSNNDIIA